MSSSPNRTHHAKTFWAEEYSRTTTSMSETILPGNVALEKRWRSMKETRKPRAPPHCPRGLTPSN